MPNSDKTPSTFLVMRDIFLRSGVSLSTGDMKKALEHEYSTHGWRIPKTDSVRRAFWSLEQKGLIEVDRVERVEAVNFPIERKYYKLVNSDTSRWENARA